jgi:hypothetical protein
MLDLGIEQHPRHITVSLRDDSRDVLLARQVSTQPLFRLQLHFGKEFAHRVFHSLAAQVLVANHTLGVKDVNRWSSRAADGPLVRRLRGLAENVPG